MLDSKEMAKAALRRVEEIKLNRRRKRRLREAAGLALCMCVVVSVVVIVIGLLPLSPPADHAFFEDGQAPLAAPLMPDAGATLYNATLYKTNETDNGPGYLLPCYDTVTIPAGSSELEMVLLNPENNPCWITFKIALDNTDETLYASGLDNTDETLYASGLVGPGMCIENPALSKTLDKGEYKAVLLIHTYGLDSFAAMNGASVEFTIIAK